MAMGCECERVPPTADAPTGSMGEPRVCVAEQVRSLSQPERLRTRQHTRDQPMQARSAP
jgi:hypothetical protein